MPLSFTCPECGRHFAHIRKEFLGKKIQCHCGRILRLGEPTQRGDSDFDVRAMDAGSSDSMAMTMMTDSLDEDDFNAISQATVVPNRKNDPAPSKKRSNAQDDYWNTKAFALDNPDKQPPKKKVNYDGLGAPTKTNDPKPQESIAASELLRNIEALPPVEFAQPLAAPLPMPPPPPSYIPTYQRAPWAAQARTTSTSKSALVALISAIGLFQCLVVGVMSIAVIASHASGLTNAQSVDNALYSEVILRIIVGVVLLLATVGFAIFLFFSLFSAGAEISEKGTVKRTAVSTSSAVAAAGYLLLLFGIGATVAVTSAGIGNPEVSSRLVGVYWPSTLAELMVILLVMALIPIVVFFTGILRVLDS